MLVAEEKKKPNRTETIDVPRMSAECLTCCQMVTTTGCSVVAGRLIGLSGVNLLN